MEKIKEINNALININICIVGEISCGKTSLVSVLINKLAGSIKMKRSTLNYNCFSEITHCKYYENNDFIFNNTDSTQISRCNNYHIPLIKFLNYDRRYLFNIYDSIGMNDIEIENDNIHFFENNLLPIIDILIIVLDGTKALSTKSEETFLKNTQKYMCHKIYVINKVDDLNDKKIMENTQVISEYLVKNKYVDSENSIIISSSKNMFDILFKTKYYYQLEHQYGNKNDQIVNIILNKFGLTALVNSIRTLSEKHLIDIWNKKLQYCENNYVKLSDAYDLLCLAQNIISCTESNPVFLINGLNRRILIEPYFKKIKYCRDSFDSNIKLWINNVDNDVVKIIAKKYIELNDDKYETMSILDISHISGNQLRILEIFLQVIDYSRNKKMFYELVKVCINNIGEQRRINILCLINDIIDKCIAEVIDAMIDDTKSRKHNQYIESEIFIMYMMLKKISRETKLVELFDSLDKMHIIEINNNQYNKFVAGLKNNISTYLDSLYLYKICMLFTQSGNANYYQNHTNISAIQCIESDLVIFPCNANQMPLIKEWYNLTQNDSQKIYQYDVLNKSCAQTYTPYNIGLLSGRQSAILVVRVESGQGAEYWKKLLLENGSECINTLRAGYGSGNYHYYFKWTSGMNRWFSKNRIFSTINCVVGIDILADDQYIVLPGATNSGAPYFFENVDEQSNIRNKISKMPEWLFKIIDHTMVGLGEKNMQYHKFKMEGQNFQTSEMCAINIMIRHNRYALEYIPDKMKTTKMCEMAVKHYDYYIKHVPDKLKTKKMCETVVRSGGTYLRCIPDEFKTKELCEIAVNKYGCNLKYVPDNLRTKELCDIAVSKSCDGLKYVPDNLKTKKLCEFAVNNNGCSLKYVPNNLRTKELCEIAVNNNGCSLYYVPVNYKKDLCNIIVNKDEHNLIYVPDNLKTKELCEIALNKSGNSFKYVPKNLKTKELCEIAVNKCGSNLHYVPEKLKTIVLCVIAVNKEGDNLQYVPDIFARKLCEIAINKKGDNLQYVPDHLKKELCDVAVSKNGNNLEYVPDDLKTQELCYIAVNNNGSSLRFVPNNLKTKKLCEMAIKNSGKYNNYVVLEFVPDKFKTKELCKLAVYANCNNWNYTPYKLRNELDELYWESRMRDQ